MPSTIAENLFNLKNDLVTIARYEIERERERETDRERDGFIVT